MNKDPQSTKRVRKNDIIIFVIIAAIIIGIAVYINRMTNQPEELAPDKFEEIIEDVKESAIAVEKGESDKITVTMTMQITPAGGENAGFYNITGTYQYDGKDEVKYVAFLPCNYIDNTVFSGEEISIDVNDDGIIDDTDVVLKNIILNNVKVEYKELVVFDWLSIVLIVVPFILIIVAVVYLFKNSSSSNNKAFEFAKSRAKSTRSKTTFNDVAGCEEEKQELEEIVDFLKTPKKYFEIGARIPKGILLEGPPGTGKTLLARAIAGEAKVPFYIISGSDFVEMFVGVGASRVRDMFKSAKQNAPCIVFIDEIDAVGRQRGTGLGGGHDEREQTLNQLLVEMDGFTENSGVIVMAATNRADILDPALLRPGRFDRRITISLPDVREREAILKVHARNKKISPKVVFEDISRRTTGFSGADLENLLNEAALLAARENRKEVKIYDIDEAIDRVIMGPAKKSRKYSEKEKKEVAYHESGHAVIGMKLENADIVQKVTIVPRGHAGGYTMMSPEKESFLQTKQGLLDVITGLLAGRVSEEMFIGEITTGAQNDFQRATRIARAMVTEYGMSHLGPIQYENGSQSVFLGRDYMSSKNFSEQVALEIDHAVRGIIEECYEKAKAILDANKDLVDLLANHLMEIETLTKEDIYELAKTGKLEWWEKKKVKLEAERIAREKEAELEQIYKKQLEAMAKAKEEAEKNASPFDDKPNDNKDE